MVQSTLDAFVRPPAPAPPEAVSVADVPESARKSFEGSVVRAMISGPGDESEPASLRHEVSVTCTGDGKLVDVEHMQHAQPKAVPRLRVAGTSTVLKVVAEAHEHVCEDGRVILVTLSWRHNYNCGASTVVVANEPRGAAFDLRPPPKPKKGEPRELPSTLSPDELVGLVDMGEEIADMLVSDERVHVVVMDGYPKGETYARLLVGIAARCIKLRRAGKDVVMPRATAPADATCKAVLACLKKCRSVEAMRTAAVDYYNEHLADRFP